MIYKIIPFVSLFLLSFAANDHKASESKTIAAVVEPSFEMEAETVYAGLNSNNFALPNLESFKEGLKGFYELKEKGIIKKDILTLIDFSLSSNTKRLWVIDLSTNTILFHSLVAHGRNTGEEYAERFSNGSESFRSSLGFYATGEIYNGKHGKSLKLDGLERGVNDNARNRAVVMHGADYVSEAFIKNHNRLGRSLGCPAIPVELTNEIINTIKDQSCLFIYHPTRSKKESLLS